MAFHAQPQAVRWSQVRRVMAAGLEKFDDSRTTGQYVQLYERMLRRPFMHDETGMPADMELSVPTAA